jgi:hypothetical protein
MAYENHLQFAFPRPYTGSSLKFSTFAQEPSDIGNITNYVNLHGVSADVDTNPVKVYVNQFAANIDSTDTSLLELQTDYFTYMLLDGQLMGSFRGNAALVPAPSVDTFTVVTREPNLLELQVTFEETTGVPFDVFAQIGHNDFTHVQAAFSNELSRAFSFNQLPDGSLIDTVTTYTVYLHVVNAHGSHTDLQYAIEGSIVASLEFNTFDLVSMGNLDTGGEIRLSIDFTFLTTLSNVSYYVTAYTPGDGPETLLEMIQPGANHVETGLLLGNETYNVVMDTDFHGNSFIENGNVLVQGLLVHGDTNKHVVRETELITLDVPVIEANVFAAPMFKE